MEYNEAARRQLERVDAIAAGREPEQLILCTHPAVVTKGRATRPEDIEGWAGSLVESTRGGRATYHGPSQIVVYPLVNLTRRGRDIHAYLRRLETSTVNTLHKIGLSRAEARTVKVGDLSLTGVWVGERKIASIGIAVRKWITYHGVALNLSDDPEAFRGIRPCGFDVSVMTNAERELGLPIERKTTENLLVEEFLLQIGP